MKHRNSYRDEVLLDRSRLHSEFKRFLGTLARDELQPQVLDSKVPLSIFLESSHKLGVLETLVKYLREECGYRFTDIAKVLDRDNKSLSNSYKNARYKLPQRFSEFSNYVPVSVFNVKGLSCFEAIVLNLKDRYFLSFGKVAAMFGRNYQTIWTTYKRARKKGGVS